MKILFLDDESWRREVFAKAHETDTVYYAQTATQAIEQLKVPDVIFDEVWLDHDLGGHIYVTDTNEETGYTVATFIESHPEIWPRIHRILLHSHNPAGVERMAAAIRNTTIRGSKQPFCIIFGHGKETEV